MDIAQIIAALNSLGADDLHRLGRVGAARGQKMTSRKDLVDLGCVPRLSDVLRDYPPSHQRARVVASYHMRLAEMTGEDPADIINDIVRATAIWRGRMIAPADPSMASVPTGTEMTCEDAEYSGAGPDVIATQVITFDGGATLIRARLDRLPPALKVGTWAHVRCRGMYDLTLTGLWRGGSLPPSGVWRKNIPAG